MTKSLVMWFYCYLLLPSIWLYIIGVALALDFFLPTFDRDYTEMIFPSAITVATLFVVLRIPRVNRFMWKVFGTDQKASDAKQKE